MNLRPIQSELFLSLQPLVLVLLDITPMMTVLEGVVMELQDCALPLLRGAHKAFFLYLYCSNTAAGFRNCSSWH